MPQAERKVDEHFSKQINALIGPFGVLHAVKRLQAEFGGALVDGDREDILARAAEQDAAIAILDKQRRGIKARLRAAKTSIEINAILGELG
ncbi:hypothetical protein BFN67_17685 [Pseudaminobacter manganicus]|uniref:Uncharacterized protein n=1 Tax=Manganibacter manganicus TaxID=1873176 RepID=A0A1V8RR55_9HYPH|nr:hypothetical protein BFN67_17685 [Pseudaminobacter manganicus]